jgi:FkbH-like protein
MALDLDWLPEPPSWDASIESLRELSDPTQAWALLQHLAAYRLNFLQTAQLDRLIQKHSKKSQTTPSSLKAVRLALLGSSTLKHLVSGIRVAGLRRGLWIEVFEGDYGQYLHELLETKSQLHQFAPEFVCFAFDAPHLLKMAQGDPSAAIQHLQTCWKLATEAFACTVIQQTALPVLPDAFGSNEHRMVESPQHLVATFNWALATAADAAGVHLLAVDKYSARDGLTAWHDPALWLRTQQEVHPAASPLYGDLLVRLIAAQRGRSAKCLVLDLDNTLWGGVIGDDGLNGIVLGPGNPTGEAFAAIQRYALRLKQRGILLAVCSKNDEANALAPFDSHPDMLLKRTDIACFIANWSDKAGNLRHIATTLNIGTDALVFVDDNPFERNLVRREMPEVMVPELPADPALYVDSIARSGYFEALHLTEEDRARAEQYRANAERDSLRASTTDLAGYLSSLQMELTAAPFDEAGMQRIVQLINKTNQFNLTTRRYTEPEARALLQDKHAMTWQIRLKDRFGDNGMIALLIGRHTAKSDLEIDTWLMSCRVLGRQVELESLNLLVAAAQRAGLKRIIGEYRPTAKNAMVKKMFEQLGFSLIETADDGTTRWALTVDSYVPLQTPIRVSEEIYAGN